MTDRSRPLLRTLVGRVLRRHRLEQERTLAEVARDAAVSVQYLSEVERGRKEPSSEILAAVCDALGVELSDLLAEVGRELVEHRAPVLRLRPVAPVTPVVRPMRRPTTPPHRSGDVMLLAA
ncbi:helix-turn-helix domain-containing protein [Paractinoplanes atraurantiacus]|uniref:Helix-turn-helix domain-containing protein n=1 Tax=Paractinoplanes atraurantiacus TaxID=1036182 RepID=A0A285J3B2_9ACTN|nr:Helix-turn-helix domain-containing protein [Actinoplanes atraurantiacus]